MLTAYLRAPGKSGLARVDIIYKSMFIPCRVKIPPACWDHDKQKVKASFPEHKKANSQIAKKKAPYYQALAIFFRNPSK